MFNQDGKLQKGDKILTIDDENVENIPHQDVIKKLRLLNEEATNSITLCVLREEACQGNSKTMKVWTWSNFITLSSSLVHKLQIISTGIFMC